MKTKYAGKHIVTRETLNSVEHPCKRVNIGHGILGALALVIQSRQLAMRQLATWSVARELWFSSAK